MGNFSLRLGISFLLVIAVLTWACLEWLPALGYYPRASVHPTSDITLELFLVGHMDERACQRQIDSMRPSIQQSCPACRVELACNRGLAVKHRQALSGLTLDGVSLRIVGGVLLVSAGDTDVAFQICEGVRRSQPLGSLATAGELCIAPGKYRSRWRL